MSGVSPLSYDHLSDVLFVTTPEAIDRFDQINTTGMKENRIDYVGSLFGDRLLKLPGGQASVDAAAELVRERIQNLSQGGHEINGVVLLGDYEAIPSQNMTTYTWNYLLEENPSEPKKWGDADLWQVWTDDLYGDTDDDRLAELPVSRIPIPPKVGGILGDAPTFDTINPRVAGVRSDDCPFADGIFERFLLADAFEKMGVSPPMAADGSTDSVDLDDQDLAAERLYLVLHGQPFADTFLTGADGTVAVNFDVAGGTSPSRGVVFAAACWGGLTSRAAMQVKELIDARNATNSIALALLNRGANAIVGFTGMHYVEKYEQFRYDPELIEEQGFPPHLFGSPLHHLFWKNIIVQKLQPMDALFQARQSYIANPALENGDKVAKLNAVKTFWSATCLGLGRLPRRAT